MRRATILVLLMVSLSATAFAAEPRARRAAPAGQPPHAWLFGAWTGGLFPVIEGQMARDCQAGGSVVFTQEFVLHGSLTTAGLVRRVIETVRTTSQGADFRFTPVPGDTGFGCASTDELTVLRSGPNAITFPGCAAFPYALQRCGAS